MIGGQNDQRRQMISRETNAVEPIDTPHGSLRTRPETAGDMPFLAALHASVKAAEFATLPTGEPIRQQLLDMQFRAMTMSYRAAFPNGRFEVITLDDVPIGQLITDSSPDRFHIVYIALLPEWRQRRIGTLLMTRILEVPRSRGTRCEATVVLDNVASQRLWSRLGLTERAQDSVNLILEWRPE
jgi:ribosomal protein S18 acetylase RimI-like enzyme